MLAGISTFSPLTYIVSCGCQCSPLVDTISGDPLFAGDCVELIQAENPIMRSAEAPIDVKNIFMVIDVLVTSMITGTATAVREIPDVRDLFAGEVVFLDE